MAHASPHLDPSGVSTEDPRGEETQWNWNATYYLRAPDNILSFLETQEEPWDTSHFSRDAATLVIPFPDWDITGKDSAGFGHSTSNEPERTPFIDPDPTTTSTNIRYEVPCHSYGTRPTSSGPSFVFRIEPTPRMHGLLPVPFLNMNFSPERPHTPYKSPIQCSSWERCFSGEYRNTRRLARHMGGGSNHDLVYSRRNRRSHVNHGLARVALKILCGSCATLCALGGTDTGQSILNSGHLLRHGEHASTETTAQLLCIAGFIASISFFYRSSPENRQQDYCLIVAILVGVSSGMLVGMSIQDTVRRIIPWTVIGLLLVSDIAQTLISSGGSSYVVDEKDPIGEFEEPGLPSMTSMVEP